MLPQKSLAYTTMLAACTFATTALGTASPPNIVVILADDLGAHELGVYGHPTHQTPHLDQLARGGIYFNTAYAMPVCHPSRHALMTGQYPHHNGVFHFPNRAGGPRVENHGADNIAAHLTFGQLFHEAGYATALAGKWQLSGQLPTLVRETGFDEYCMWAYANNLPAGVEHTGGWENGPGSRTSRYWHPSLLQNGTYRSTTINDYGPDLFTDFLIDFVHRNQTDKRRQPFLLYYSMALTHEPYYPTPDSITNPGDKFKKSEGNWRANVEYMDKLVGRLVAALEESGLRENTLIVFMGDNGTGLHGKGETTEMGARVPLIINGPGLVKPQGLSPELADITDIFPTLCAVAGVRPPANQGFDGISLAPYLRGETKPLREWVYAPLGGRRTLRTKRWLLENNTPWGFGRLYDCGDSRNGTGYLDVTHLNTPEVLGAKSRLRAILADLPVPEVDPADPRMLGREKPHYVAPGARHDLNSPVIIDLWPEGVPNPRTDMADEPSDDPHSWSANHPTLTVYPSLHPVKGAPLVVVCPENDRHRLPWQDGSTNMARWLNSIGITAGVLNQRRYAHGHPAPLQDVQRAIRLLRARAGDFGGAPDNIGVIGAATGGHLAASSAVLYDRTDGPDLDPLPTVSARPDFMILLFPVITRLDPPAAAGSRAGLLVTRPGDEDQGLLALEEQVTPATPPAFIVTTNQEKIAEGQNPMLFCQALHNAGVPCELHVMEEGEPGSAAHDLVGPIGSWSQRAERWLVHGGFLPAGPHD
ncbi:MAG: sulfatase-like hydrolase/transferase [Cephaloticoccus sp.]|nr:sulfatase-like hydrolase/transferase [Cephaloticoccus sp.]